MKKILAIASMLVLTAALFTGCGCTNRNVSDDPNGMITDATTVAPSTNPMPTMTTPPEDTTMPHPETTVPTPSTLNPGTTDATVNTEPGMTDTQPGTGDTGESATQNTHPSDQSKTRSHGR